MAKRRRAARGAPPGATARRSGELWEATPREAREVSLARAAAAGRAPQEEGLEEEEEEEGPALDAGARAAPGASGAIGGPRRLGRARRLGRRRGERLRLAKWAEGGPQLDRWVSSRGGGLEGPVTEAAGGMLRCRDFFPAEVADSVLRTLERLPEEAWELSEQGDESDAARHRFWSTDVCDVPLLAALRGVFWRMLPSFRGEPTLPLFSCGRYGASDFIGGHDDRAHVPFFRPGNVYSRTVAAIWYLTRDWHEDDGGCLLDLQASAANEAGGVVASSAASSLVPVYNSLVVFEVPHWHAVSAVRADRYRYSIFGWWHQQGQRYELPAALSAGRAEGRPRRGKGKRKAKADAQAGECDGSPSAGVPQRAVGPLRKRKQIGTGDGEAQVRKKVRQDAHGLTPSEA